MAAKVLCEKKSIKKSKPQAKSAGEPRRLSKFGEWMKRNPDGIIEVLDLKAVMK